MLAGLGEALAGAARDGAQSVRVQAAWGLANLADTMRLAAAAAAGGTEAHTASPGDLLLIPAAAARLPGLCTGKGACTQHNICRVRQLMSALRHGSVLGPWV